MADNTKVIESLKNVLADTYTLYLKTQYYHWNVKGPNFYSYHAMFEAQYKELADVVDVVAEEIRAAGAKSPGSFKEFLKASKVSDDHIDGKADEMIQDLVKNHEVLLSSLGDLKEAAADCGSQAEDLADARVMAHEKIIWMLNSSLA